jgi:serine/threonine protein kinase/tetratricopeptide (TPR) repeat protein
MLPPGWREAMSCFRRRFRSTLSAIFGQPMDKALWQTLSPLLDRALDLPAGDRASMLETLRSESPDLASALAALLADHERLDASGFLDDFPSAGGVITTLTGQRVGAYTLERRLGVGGMGTVWLGHRSDGRFEGAVALKFINFAVLDPVAEARFRREGTVLARLSHPHIARLLDAGVSDAGQPYLVLEYVDGQRIDAYADTQRLRVRERLELFLQVADAVAHAHAAMVVHRDLKPSNVLVDRDGRVKLLDFGVATLLAAPPDAAGADPTSRGFTAMFAAPEQVLGGPVTAATDVYALGVLLYRLLTGRHPTAPAGASDGVTLRALADVDPIRASTAAASLRQDGAEGAARLAERQVSDDQLAKALRGDLDTVLEKALAKLPADRYATVTAFADDVRRHLTHEPVRARPDSTWYRVRKFIVRRRLETGLAAVAALALLGGTGVALWQARVATTERDFARRQLARSQAINELNEFLLSDAAPVGTPFTAEQVLARAERILARQTTATPEAQVASLVTIGRQYAGQDDDANAIRVLEQAYARARALADPSLRATAGCALAAALSAAGTDPRPPELLREAFAVLPATETFALDRVFCQLQAGIVERNGATPEASIAHVMAAQHTLAASNVRSAVLDLRVAMDLAESYRTAGDARQAHAQFAVAWEKLTQQGRDDTEAAGTLLNNWGLVRRAIPLDAERLFRRAVQIGSADGSDHGVSPMLLTNLGWALLDLHRFSEGIAVATLAAATAERVGAGAVIYQNQLLRARLYHGAGDDTQASAVLDEFERRAPELVPKGHPAFTVLLELRASIAAARHRFAEARAYLAEAFATVDETRADHRQPFLTLYRVRAGIALLQGHTAQAVADASRAVELAIEIDPGLGPSYALGRTRLVLGEAQLADGRLEDARASLTAAAADLESAGGADHPQLRQARALLQRLEASAGAPVPAR